MSYIGKGVETVTFNTATTLDVAGNITLGGTVDGRDVATDGTKLDTITSGAIADILQDTTPQLGGNLDLNTSNVIGTGNINVTGSITGTSFVSTGNMSFTNNSKAIFGTSPSLEIYHDGSNSILDDVGAGNFKMQLAGADKLEITSTGVSVTGSLNTTGNVGIGINSPSAKLDIRPSNDATNTFRIYRGVDSGYQLDYLNISQYTGDSIFNSVSSGGANNEFIFQQNGSERLRIDSSGNVGIGTTPESFAKLEVKTATDRNIAIFDNAVGPTIGAITDAGASQALRIAGQTIIMTGAGGAGAEHLRIDGSGNVGIGVSSMTNKLVLPNAAYFAMQDTSGAESLAIRANSSNAMEFLTGGGVKAIIDTSGNVGIGAVPSGQRLLLANTSANAVNIQLQNNAASNLFIGADTTNLVFYNGGSERLRIDSSGNVGIGTTNPAGNKLSVEGGANGGGFYQRLKHTGSAGQNNTAIFNIATASNTNTMEVNEQFNYSAFRHLGNLVNHYSDVDNHHFRTKGGVAKMTIDSSGRVIMPSQPVFSGNRFGLATANGLNSNVNFTPVVNQGNHWNTSTHSFTCPVAGKYWVSVFNLNYTAINSGASNIQINKNNGSVFTAYQDSPSNVNYSNSSASGVLSCAANDVITFFSPAGVVYGDQYCGATVYLIG